MEAGTGAAEEMELLAVTFEGLFQREGLSVDIGVATWSSARLNSA